jgi:hypothetical protein
MHLYTMITVVAIGALYGLAWHNQPARPDRSERADEERSRPARGGRVLPATVLNREKAMAWVKQTRLLKETLRRTRRENP